MNLPSRQQRFWCAYYSQVTMRDEALERLSAFLESMTELSVTDRDLWALDVARRVADEKLTLAVRMPLFKTLLFPALLRAIHSGDAAAPRWLAALNQLLYKCPWCMAVLPDHMRSEYGLVRESFRRDSTDSHTKRRMVAVLRHRLGIALHELPSGVLYGHNGASPAQCDELIDDVEEYRRLLSEIGMTPHDEKLLALAVRHIPAYKEYLTQVPRAANFAAFLKHYMGSIPASQEDYPT